ncbi:MAG: NUDIX domain-containing protein [Candidatus Bathyarchaeia archaeon]
MREAKEETGLDVDVVEILGVVDKIVRDEEARIKYHFVIVDYLAEAVGGTMKASSDALEASWVKAEEFPRYRLTPTLVELLKRMGIYPETTGGGA